MTRLKKKSRTRESASADYKEVLARELQDPAEAIAYLNAALDDEDHRILLLALRDVANAQSISQVAGKSGLNRENLYRILSPEGNPRLSSFLPLLRSLGLELSIKNRGLLSYGSKATVAATVVNFTDYIRIRKPFTGTTSDERGTGNQVLDVTA
jgi:probable addiction module antidote protein